MGFLNSPCLNGKENILLKPHICKLNMQYYHLKNIRDNHSYNQKIKTKKQPLQHDDNKRNKMKQKKSK